MKELFYKLTHSKQNKIIGLSSVSDQITFYSKPWCSIVKSNEMSLDRVQKINKNISNSSLLEKEMFNKYLISSHICFEINKEISCQSKIDYLLPCSYINNMYIGLTITNKSLHDIGNKDNIGWFYSKEQDESFLISKSIPLDSRLKLSNYFIEVSYMNQNHSKLNLSDIMHQQLPSLRNLVKYITLYPGDIILSDSLFPSISLNEKENIINSTLFDQSSVVLDLKAKFNLI